MWVFRFRQTIIFTFLALATLSVFFISKLKFDPNISKHLPENSLEISNYDQSGFPSGEGLIYIGIYNEKGILRKPFLDSLHKVSLAIRKIQHIQGTLSITTLKDIEKNAFGYIPYRIVSREQQFFTSEDSISIKNDPRIFGWLVSKDFKGALIVVETESSFLTDEENTLLIGEIETVLQGYQSSATYISGVSFIETSFLRMLIKWGPFGFILSTISIVLSLTLIYRSSQGVLVPIFSVLMGMMLFYGYLGAMNRTLNVLSVLYPSILLVVGVSDIVHFTTKYHDLLHAGESKGQAILKAYKELRVILFLTSFTTMIGFASFIRLPISIYRYFGVDSLVGIGIVFLVAIVFVPALLYYLPIPQQRKKKFKFSRLLNWINFVTSNHPNKVFVTWLCLLCIAIVGILNINTNNKISDRFAKNSEPYQNIQFFEQHFAGTRYADVRVHSSEEQGFKSISALRELDKIHQYFINKEIVDNVFSPITMYNSINKSNHGRSMAFYELPVNQEDMDRITKELERFNALPAFSFITKDFKTARFSFLLPDLGRQECSEFNQDFYKWSSNNISNTLELNITGYNELSDLGTSIMITSMFESFGWALLIIALVMALVYRSVKLVVISIIPNLLPLLLIGGFIGYTGIVLDSSIVLIFTISFVIVIDDTMHMLAKYKLEVDKNVTKTEAIRQTIINTGPPVILTSIILFFGFGVLLLSPFKEAYLSGVLAPITVLLAVLADLLLLPALLQKFVK